MPSDISLRSVMCFLSNSAYKLLVFCFTYLLFAISVIYIPCFLSTLSGPSVSTSTICVQSFLCTVSIFCLLLYLFTSFLFTSFLFPLVPFLFPLLPFSSLALRYTYIWHSISLFFSLPPFISPRGYLISR